MIITVKNLTDDTISFHNAPATSKFHINRKTSATTTDPPVEVLPTKGASTTLSKGFSRELILRRVGAEDQRSNDHPEGDQAKLLSKEWHVHPEGLKISFSMKFAASWQVVSVPDDCPWRIFVSRVTRQHHRLVVMKKRNMAAYLTDLPDRLPLYSLSLPGTHDTMAFFGWPISQCQNPDNRLSTQLNDGIRIIDIRLAVVPPPSPGATELDPKVNHQLIAYHGLWPQQATFQSILDDLHDFLSSPIGQRETIIMSLKQEDFALTPAPIFSQLVKKEIISGAGGWDDTKPSNTGVNRGMWFLENRFPTLGEVRGKVVMFSRFGGNGAGWENGLEGLGIHPTTWPDSKKEGFQWELKGVTVRTHDWYGIPTFFSIPEKVQMGTENLIPPSPNNPPTLPITYFSAASIPFALPPIIAKGFGIPKWGIGFEGVNSKLGAWLLSKLGESALTNKSVAGDQEKRADAQKVEPEVRIRGWTFLDYYSEPEGAKLIPLLAECNFRGRTAGEEGW